MFRVSEQFASRATELEREASKLPWWRPFKRWTLLAQANNCWRLSNQYSGRELKDQLRAARKSGLVGMGEMTIDGELI